MEQATINYSVLNVCMDKVDNITSSYDRIEEKWCTTKYLSFYNKPALINCFVMSKDNYSKTKYFLAYIVVNLNEIVNESLIKAINNLPEKQKNTVKHILYEWKEVDKCTIRKNMPSLFCACVITKEPKNGFKDIKFNQYIGHKLHIKLLKLMNKIDSKIVDIFVNNIGPSHPFCMLNDVDDKLEYRRKEINKVAAEISKYFKDEAYDEFYYNKFGEHYDENKNYEEIEEVEEVEEIVEQSEDDIFDFDSEIKVNVYR